MAKAGAPTRVTLSMSILTALCSAAKVVTPMSISGLRLFFFDSDLWETTAKLKAQAEQQVIGQRTYAEALCVVLVHELVRV